MRESTVTRWLGVGLSTLGVIATLWLAATGRLTLYIHPRYVVFTVVMAVIGGALIIGAVLLSTRRHPDSRDEHSDHDEHGHEHESAGPSRGPSRMTAVGGVLLAAVATVVLLALPPASLSTGALSAAELDTTQASTLDTAPDLVGGDTTTFNVKDWAALLRQGLTAGDLAGMEADVIGFVAPDPAGDADRLYLARFSVTCCAVDAQPIAIPVSSPRWSDTADEGGWVRVTGTFVDSSDPEVPTVLDARSIEAIDEPADPYVF